MQLTDILFYAFSSLAVIASLVVVSSRNPVYSVLWLIFCFFNCAGIFILLGAELVAMLLVIVYVGAVAVLFLFVVMMLNIKTATLKKGFQSYLPVGLLLAAILMGEMWLVMSTSIKKTEKEKTEQSTLVDDDEKKEAEAKLSLEESILNAEAAEGIAEGSKEKNNTPETREINTETNTNQIGEVLYTDYILMFQTSGLILLVAMIGAIVLTLRHRDGVLRQNVTKQTNRTKLNSIEIVKVETGKGI